MVFIMNDSNINTPSLGIYRTHEDIKAPEYKTKEAACFDLAFNPSGKEEYTIFDSHNRKSSRFFLETPDLVTDKSGNLRNMRSMYINPGERVMVPTGLIFDIPMGWQINIYPRSGTSLKEGIMLANCVGVVDSDYIDEVMILAVNNTSVKFTLHEGARIAQAQIARVYTPHWYELATAPKPKGDRIGGYGSTGK